jgi:hypothetical protein
LAGVVLLALAVAACGPKTIDTTRVVRGAKACASLDSVLARGLPGRPWRCSGKATFDVEEYRVRGRYRLTVSGRQSILFEFEGTMLLGGHREDIAVSLEDDTLRVLDREHGAYYAGDDVNALIQRGTGTGGDWVGAIRALVGYTPECSERLEIRGDGEHVSGLLDGGAFVLTTDGRRLQRASWPDPTASRTYSDRLDVRYEWDAGRLAGITVSLPKRGWRIKLTVE